MAPNGLTYSSPQAFTVGRPISAMTPTVSGTVTNYSISPALPTGLSLDTASGAISGTPSQMVATTAYTVTAANSGGSTSTTIDISVNDASPVVVYEADRLTFTAGVPATVAPTSSGGTVISWTIAPALPEGLSFNAANGNITGTPTSASDESSYAITAQNSGGTATVNLAISVDSGVLLNLGHDGEIERIRAEGARTLSSDKLGHWALWNSQTNALVSQGDVTCTTSEQCATFADLAGSTVVIKTADALQLRTATDGHVVATITDPVSWWKLAVDGSYVAIGNSTELKAWSSAGALMFSRAGDYSQASAFAASDELRVARGAAGTNVVEGLSIPSGTSTTTPAFLGQFHSWFLDGERFLTNVGNTVWVYSEDGVQQDLRALPSTTRLTGQGDWFWIHDGNAVSLNIYSVGASASPAATYSLHASAEPVPSRHTIALLGDDLEHELSIIDLSGASPVITDHPIPLPHVSAYGWGAYALGTQGERLIGHGNGVLADVTVTSTPKFYGYGQATSIAAGPARIAVATALGVVVFFDSATRTQEGELWLSTGQIQLSADGTVLAAAINDQLDRSLKLVSLPTGTEIRSWPYTHPSVRSVDFSMSASGAVLGRILATYNTTTGVHGFDRAVLPADGGAPIWSDALSAPIRLSPDGTAVAVVNGPADPNAATNILLNGTLSNAVSGWASGWLDNDRLLVNRFEFFGRFDSVRFTGAYVINRAGQETLTPLTEAQRILQPIDANRFYADNNRIYSVSTGEILWSSPNPWGHVGAVTADHVIFRSGATVRAEPY